MTESWYLARQKQRLGPYTVLQLRQMVAAGELQRADMLLKHGAQTWIEASSLSWLFSNVAQQERQSPPSAALPNSVSGNDIVLVYQKTGQTVKLISKQMRIGRGEGNHISLTSQSVSRQHAIVEREEDRVWVTDLASRNGTFLNNNKAALQNYSAVSFRL